MQQHFAVIQIMLWLFQPGTLLYKRFINSHKIQVPFIIHLLINRSKYICQIMTLQSPSTNFEQKKQTLSKLIDKVCFYNS